MTEAELFFRKIGRTLRLIPEQAAPPADPLLKRNLSPVMGRRDAAMDLLAIPADLFSMPTAPRLKIYRKRGGLLASALYDTKQILGMLSSPDTRHREKRYETVIRIELNMMAALISTVEVQLQLEKSRPEGCTAETDNAVSRCESMLLNEFREFFSATRMPVDRYREYATKSFSPANLTRYRKAYEASSKRFDNPDFPDEE